jgi:branched-chain amino acid aminotransferase
MPEAQVYLNGRNVPASQAHVAIYDAGLVMGATVTEQTRTFHHKAFRLEAHLERLFHSLAGVGFEINLTQDELAAVTLDLIERNAPLLPPGGELGVIHFVTAGEVVAYAGFERGWQDPFYTAQPAPSAGEPTVCVHTFPLDFRRWTAAMREGAHLVIPSIRQIPPRCIDPAIKCRSRMHYYLADREARAADPAASALLLDLNGHITETSSANFLIVERDTIVSPTLNETLSGISRATVVELAERLGIQFTERDLLPSDAVRAEEAWLTSTPYCLLPVTKIDGIAKPGPLFRRFITAWSELVGLDIERQVADCK